MTYWLAVVVGIVAGTIAGLVAERAPVSPAIQSAASAIMGMLLAAGAAAVMWLLRPPADAEVLAVSFGLVESLITSVGVLLLAAAGHAFLGWVGLSHRPITLGILGALCGAITATSGVGFVHALK